MKKQWMIALVAMAAEGKLPQDTETYHNVRSLDYLYGAPAGPMPASRAPWP